MRQRWLVMVWAVVVLGVAPATSRAQNTDVKMQSDEADGLMAQERFTEAGALYQSLFESTKQSDYLYKSANAYERGDDAQRALALYQQYLAVEPGGEHSKDAYEAVERLSPDVGSQPQRGPGVFSGDGDADATVEHKGEPRPISVDLAALLAVPVGNLGDADNAPGVRLALGYFLGAHFRPGLALHYVRLASGVSFRSLRLGARARTGITRTIDLFADLELGYDTFSEDGGDDVHSETSLALRGGASYRVNPLVAVMWALSYDRAPIGDSYLEFANIEAGALLSF